MRQQKPAVRKTAKLTGKLGRGGRSTSPAPEFSTLTRVEHWVSALINLTPRYLNTAKAGLSSLESGVPIRHRSGHIGWLTHTLITSAIYSLVVLYAHFFLDTQRLAVIPHASEIAADYKPRDYVLVFVVVTGLGFLIIGCSKFALRNKRLRQTWTLEFGSAWYTYTALTTSVHILAAFLVGLFLTNTIEFVFYGEARPVNNIFGYIPTRQKSADLVLLISFIAVPRIASKLFAYQSHIDGEIRLGRSLLIQRAECAAFAITAAFVPALASYGYNLLKPLAEVAAGERTVIPKLKVDSLGPFDCKRTLSDAHCVLQATVQGRGTWRLFLPSVRLISVESEKGVADETDGYIEGVHGLKPELAYQISSPSASGDFLEVDQKRPLLAILHFKFTPETCDKVQNILPPKSKKPRSLFLFGEQVDPVKGFAPVIFGPWEDSTMRLMVDNPCEIIRQMKD